MITFGVACWCEIYENESYRCQKCSWNALRKNGTNGTFLLRKCSKENWLRIDLCQRSFGQKQCFLGQNLLEMKQTVSFQEEMKQKTNFYDFYQ